MSKSPVSAISVNIDGAKESHIVRESIDIGITWRVPEFDDLMTVKVKLGTNEIGGLITNKTGFEIMKLLKVKIEHAEMSALHLMEKRKNA